MSDEEQQPAWLRWGVASELTKQYGAEGRGFFQSLALLLERALPDETQIEKRGGLFSKKELFRVTVALGDNRYVLEAPERGPLRATRTHIVRNIALKTEEISVEDWIAELGAILDERAKSSLSAREALSRFGDF